MKYLYVSKTEFLVYGSKFKFSIQIAVHCPSFVKAEKRKVSLSIIQELLLLILLLIHGNELFYCVKEVSYDLLI